MKVRYLAQTPIFQDPRLRVRGIGIAETMPATYVTRPAGTGDYFFVALHDEGWVGPPEAPQAIQAGTLVLWRPADGHFYGHPHRPWSHSWVHCDGPAVAQALRESGLPTGTPIALPDPSRAEKYLFDLHEELTGNDRPDFVILRNTLQSWLREVRRATRPDARPAPPAALRDLKRALERNYTRPQRLDALAASVGLSVPHFCSQFKRYFGTPALAYVTELRLREAIRLLRHTELSVAAIASHVGYDDIYHFSKLFKRHIGVSPSRLRMRGVK